MFDSNYEVVFENPKTYQVVIKYVTAKTEAQAIVKAANETSTSITGWMVCNDFIARVVSGNTGLQKEDIIGFKTSDENEFVCIQAKII